MFEEPYEGCPYDTDEAAQKLYDYANMNIADEPEWKQEYIKPDKGKKCKSKSVQKRRIYRVQTR